MLAMHARAVDEAGLRGDEQQRRLREQREHDEAVADRQPAERQPPANALEQHRVERLAALRRHVEQQVGRSGCRRR